MGAKILVTAHAGCLNTPRNSLESVSTGINAGADVIEVDIRFAGTIPVLSHDRIKPEQDTMLVRLSEVLDSLKDYPEIKLNLDLKEIDGIKELNRLLTQTGMASRTFFTGLGPEAIPPVRAATQIPYLVNYKPDVSQIRDLGFIKEFVAMVTQLGAFGLNTEYWRVSDLLVHTFHEAGLKVYVWTVDAETDMRNMIQMGLDSITSEGGLDRLIAMIRGIDVGI